MPSIPTQERNRSIRAIFAFRLFSRISGREPSFRDFFSIAVPPKKRNRMKTSLKNPFFALY